MTALVNPDPYSFSHYKCANECMYSRYKLFLPTILYTNAFILVATPATSLTTAATPTAPPPTCLTLAMSGHPLAPGAPWPVVTTGPPHLATLSLGHQAPTCTPGQDISSLLCPLGNFNGSQESSLGPYRVCKKTALCRCV